MRRGPTQPPSPEDDPEADDGPEDESSTAPDLAPEPVAPAGDDGAGRFRRRRANARAEWYSRLSRLAPDVQWSVKRTAPPFDAQRRSVTGILADRVWSGPVNQNAIFEAYGGGTFFFTLDDAANPDAEWIGPMEIAGEPRTIARPEAAPKSASPDEADPYVDYFDPERNEMIRRRRSAIHARAAPRPEALLATLLEENRKAIASIVEAVKPAPAPAVDATLELEKERLRLQSEKEKFAAQLAAEEKKRVEERDEHEKKRAHELAKLQLRIDARKGREDARKSELEALKRQVEDLRTVRTTARDADPKKVALQFISDVKELAPQLLGGARDDAPARESEAPTLGEQVLSAIKRGISAAYPDVAPALRAISARIALENGVPAEQIFTPPAQIAAHPQPGAPAPAGPMDEAVFAIGLFGTALDEQRDPAGTWAEIAKGAPQVAAEFQATPSAEALAAELEGLAKEAGPVQALFLRNLCARVRGDRKGWVERLLAAARAGRPFA